MVNALRLKLRQAYDALRSLVELSVDERVNQDLQYYRVLPYVLLTVNSIHNYRPNCDYAS